MTGQCRSLSRDLLQAELVSTSTQLRAMFVMRVMLHEYSMVRSRVQILFAFAFVDCTHAL